MDRIDAVRQFVSQRCGLYFKDHNLTPLDQAVADRMKIVQARDGDEYYQILTEGAGKNDELRELVNLLTINHTYFFRNERHMNALREHILPALIDQKRALARKGLGLPPALRVWSAGCSTGEEPYSLAMMLEELGAYSEGWPIEILGTDVNTNAIAAAQKGVYSLNTVRGVEPALKEKYFKKIEVNGLKMLELSKSIKDRVRFGDLNLLSGEFPSGMDLIFCRNVLIYFELPTTIEVVNKMFRSLNNDGYFFLGYSETMAYVSDQFVMEEYDQAIFYRKETLSVSPQEAQGYSPVAEAEQIVEKISEAEVAANKTLDREDGGSKKNSEQLQVEVLKCIHKKEYDQAFVLIEQIKSIDTRESAPFFFAAEIHMNRQEFQQARTQLSHVLMVNPLSAPAHFLSGVVSREMGEMARAEREFKKTLFIEGKIPLAHFYLGLISKDQSRMEDAVRHFRNTLESLNEYARDEILPHSQGIIAGVLLNMCRDNIDRCKHEQYPEKKP